MKEQLETLVGQMFDRGIRLDEGIAEFEKCFIRHALRCHNDNLLRAARGLGIHRNTLSRKVGLYRLSERRRRARKEKIPPQRVGTGRKKKVRESA